jgi:hypothetical protein
MREDDRVDRPWLARFSERMRGRTFASLFEGWRRKSWERQLEQAELEARRLAEEAKAREFWRSRRY